MKKVFLTVALIAFTVAAFSQSINTQSAFNKYKDANRAKNDVEKLTYLEDARKLIDEAAINPETTNDAKTMYYKGLIYLNIYRLKGSNDTTMLGQAIQGFTKAYALDTKDKFRQDILVNLDALRTGYYDQGVNFFQNKEFLKSMEAFEQGSKLLQIINQVDTAMLATAAIAAERAERYDKAIEYLEKAIGAGYQTPAVYGGLVNAYSKMKDKENAMRVMNKARELFPQNMGLVTIETNMYLTFGEDDKAMEKLQVIAANDPNNASVYFAIGTLYDKIINDPNKSKEQKDAALEKAADAYKKAIAIDSTYFNAYYNAGSLYINQAAELQNKANNLPSDATAEYDRMIAEADKNLDSALPFLEKASQLDPKDESTLLALKQIYVRKKQNDKAKEINDRLNALKQK